MVFSIMSILYVDKQSSYEFSKIGTGDAPGVTTSKK